MTAPAMILLLLVAVGVIYGAIAAFAWFRMRGTRVVVCPETKRPAAVSVDRAHAAMTALGDNADIRLKTCSRWPERAECDQACTAQIAIAPHDTKATALLASFFRDRQCLVCKRQIPPVGVAEPRPGLYNVETGAILTWEAIPPETIPDVLATHTALCASCTLAERFRRQFPELVTDRPERPEQDLYQ